MVDRYGTSGAPASFWRTPCPGVGVLLRAPRANLRLRLKCRRVHHSATEEKDDDPDEEEADHGVEEESVVDRGGSRVLRRLKASMAGAGEIEVEAREVDVADYESDGRHDHVLHEGVHDRVESRADNDRDREREHFVLSRKARNSDSIVGPSLWMIRKSSRPARLTVRPHRGAIEAVQLAAR